MSAGDPVTYGLVSSLSRPRENVTGVSMITVALAAKRVELLHEIIPKSAAIALLVNPTSPYLAPETKDATEAARLVGRRMPVLNASNPSEIDAAFANLAQQRAGGIVVSGDPFFDSQREKLVELAARHRVAAIYQWDEFVTIGGLMSYGTSITSAYREAGIYTARILKGAKPADLPVLQSAKVDLVIVIE